ncbi:flagellar hook-associated protein FlgL [Bacillus sp. CGMCC 1.16607]|uniref:flagellar hook-associated protein FlgL n=1 Tax=Bacillus sp. CGMCC 1.16607 TaxID=3351842 RepID=UPI00363D0E4A
MRVTQSMLSNSNLKYISQNYNRLGSLQDQINSGKKITKPSDDPVIAMKGMRFRSQVVEVEQFKRNLNEGFSWMDNSDSALDEAGQVIQRIRELTVQASNDSYDANARQNISKEIDRLQEHLVALANSKVGDNYIFNGTDTSNAPINANQMNMDFTKFVDGLKTTPATSIPSDYVISYQGETYKYNSGTTFKTNTGNTISIDLSTGAINHEYKEKLKYQDGQEATVKETISSADLVLSKNTAVSTNTENVEIEVMKGVTIPINIRAQDAFSNDLFSGIESIKKMLNNPTTRGEDISKALDSLDGMMNNVVATRAELGAQVNRTEMVQNRLLHQEVVAKKTVSDNEDIDFEKAIIDLTVQESIHRAALAMGARIIQPTLMDFLR